MMYWLVLVFFILLSHTKAEKVLLGKIKVADINGDDRTVYSSDESLRRLVESLMERVDRQDAKIQSLEMVVKDTMEDLKRKENKISQLERELRTVLKPYQNLANNRKDMPAENSTGPSRPRNIISDDMDVIHSGQESVMDSNKEQSSSKSVRVLPNGSGAFSVSLSGQDLALHPGLVIAFDEVQLDVDGNYHPGDGVYTVPVSGVYVFTWCITGTTTDNVVTELIVNGSPRGTAFSDAESGHTWDSSTGVIVTSVHADDHVFIRSKFSGSIHSSSSYGKARFSGWRLT